MDDSFAFRTTMPLRRRFDPRVVKAAFSGTLVVLGIGLFAHWVMASERESFSRTSERGVPTEATGSQVDDLTWASMPADTEETTGIALDAAKTAFSEHRSFLDAGPAQLSVLQPGYIFVDGPSTTSRVVSVAATTDTWAAAVQGPGGACYWIRVTREGDVTRGIGSDCTGSAALQPSGSAIAAPR
jgi:hypothetical protein